MELEIVIDIIYKIRKYIAEHGNADVDDKVRLDTIKTVDALTDAMDGLANKWCALGTPPIIRSKWEFEHGAWCCSECGEDNPYGIDYSTNKFSRYCPHCGTKMQDKL